MKLPLIGMNLLKTFKWFTSVQTLASSLADEWDRYHVFERSQKMLCFVIWGSVQYQMLNLYHLVSYLFSKNWMMGEFCYFANDEEILKICFVLWALVMCMSCNVMDIKSEAPSCIWKERNWGKYACMNHSHYYLFDVYLHTYQ